MSNSGTTLTIERIGNEGDGLARTADGRMVVVPFALPGEVIVDGVAISRSPDRQAPACPHFMQCGGCVAQHMGQELYVAWKRDLVVNALQHHKIVGEVAPLVRVAPGTRRRATFSLMRGRDGTRLAFHRRRDAAVLALDTCPMITPRMAAALPMLGRMAARLAGVTDETRLLLADLDGGLDVLIEGASAALDADRRSDVARLALKAGVARLSIGRDTILANAVVSLPGSAGSLTPQPGAFFQAAATAEAAIIDAVLEGLPKKPKRIVDLFAGLGTLTLPLARHASVLAVDSDKPALAALEQATRHATGLKPVTTRYRDLIGEPLSPKELEVFDTAVLDPPRAGAKAQVDTILRSKVQTVVMVSCNPQSLARDVAALVGGGFKLNRVTPIDQFVWSEHVEAVACLSR